MNCTAFRMLVRRDNCCSMADTKASIRATKASACSAASVAVGRGVADQSVRRRLQSRCTSAKACCDRSSWGTKSGRAGSPERRTVHALVELRHQPFDPLRVGIRQRLRQAPGLHAHPAGLVHGGSPALQLPGHPQREPDRGQGHQQQRAADGTQLCGQAPGSMHRPLYRTGWCQRAPLRHTGRHAGNFRHPAAPACGGRPAGGVPLRPTP